MMHLLQILLPLYDKSNQPFPAALYKRVKEELTQAFGGLTAYTRSPASGTWKKEGEQIIKDDLYVYEVMTERIDVAYWKSYKQKLQEMFQQESIVIRYSEITLL